MLNALFTTCREVLSDERTDNRRQRVEDDEHQRFDSAGDVQRVSGRFEITSDDGQSSHNTSFSWDDPANVPANVQTALDTIKTAALTKFKADNDF